MRESGGWGRICQVISWDIDGLDGGNGTLLGGGNSFLHLTHIGGQGWLVTDSGWDTTQKGGYFGTGLNNVLFVHARLLLDFSVDQKRTWVKRKMLSMKRSTS